MINALRVKLVKSLIDINEKLIFERRLRKFYKQKFEGNLDVIIDVGSNKGQTIDFFLKLNPQCKIYGFEPNKALYQKLLTKYSNRPNIKLFNVGISDKTGCRLFYENILNYTSTFEKLNFRSDYLKTKATILGVKPEELVIDSYLVDVITLSEFIEAHIKEPIDVLKIDVEGHEHSCLSGLFLKSFYQHVRYLQFERHHDDMYLHKIPFGSTHNLLLTNNFNLVSVVKHGFGNLDEVIFKNSAS